MEEASKRTMGQTCCEHLNAAGRTRENSMAPKWAKSALALLACCLALVQLLSQSAEAAMNLPDGIENILGFVPKSTFQCERDGYFGDTDNDCRIFHLCQRQPSASGRAEWRHWTYACGNQTMFNQLTLTCAFVDEAIPCKHASQFQYLNEVINRPSEPFLTDADVTSGLSYYSNRIMSDGARARAFQDSQLLAQIGGQGSGQPEASIANLAAPSERSPFLGEDNSLFTSDANKFSPNSIRQDNDLARSSSIGSSSDSNDAAQLQHRNDFAQTVAVRNEQQQQPNAFSFTIATSHGNNQQNSFNNFHPPQQQSNTNERFFFSESAPLPPPPPPPQPQEVTTTTTAATSTSSAGASSVANNELMLNSLRLQPANRLETQTTTTTTTTSTAAATSSSAEPTTTVASSTTQSGQTQAPGTTESSSTLASTTLLAPTFGPKQPQPPRRVVQQQQQLSQAQPQRRTESRRARAGFQSTRLSAATNTNQQQQQQQQARQPRDANSEPLVMRLGVRSSSGLARQQRRQNWSPSSGGEFWRQATFQLVPPKFESMILRRRA